MSKLKHGMHKTPTYIVWENMVQRCTNPKNTSYHVYGGRGITIPSKWITFEGFFEDMGLRPEGFQLDRKDNDLGYSVENCKWSSFSEQQSNKQNTMYVIYHGKKMTVIDAAKILGMSPKSLRYRIYNNHHDIFAPKRKFNGRKLKTAI